MSGGLVRHTGSTAMVHAASAESWAPARASDTATWSDTPALTVADLSEGARAYHRAASPLASGVVAQGVRRVAGGAQQVRVSYSVSPAGLALVRETRALTQQHDGRYRPAGPWRVTATEQVTGPARTRTETITPSAPAIIPGMDTPDVTGAVPRDQREAYEAAGALPQVVTGRLQRLVPTATWYVGTDRARHKGGTPLRQMVELVRVSPARAVVLAAGRDADARGHLDMQAWTVTWLRWDRTPPRAQLGRGND